MLNRPAYLIVASAAMLAACRDHGPAAARCDAERAVCPQLSSLLRGVAAQEGSVVWTVDSVRIFRDTSWTLNILLRAAAGENARVVPRGLTCENFLALGLWDNAALSGPPVFSVPAERWSDNCADVESRPIILGPGVTAYWQFVHREGLTKERLRSLFRGDDAWAAAIVRRETGDSILVSKVPRFR